MKFVAWLLGKKKESQIKIPSFKLEELENRLKAVEQITSGEHIYDKFVVKAILSNNTLTVVTASGEILTSNKADRNLYEQVLVVKNLEELRQLIVPEVVAEEKKIQEERIALLAKQQEIQKKEQQIRDTCRLLEEYGDFEIKEGAIYMKGIPLSIPLLLVGKFNELIYKILYYGEEHEMLTADDEYEALKKFWMWCALNPNPHAREDLFEFLENHDLRINRNGFFFTYRRVVTVNKHNNKFKNFISNTYLKIKTKWRKLPSNYFVLEQDGEYTLHKVGVTIAHSGVNMGLLSDLYENLSKEESGDFTDAHTQTFRIQIGKEVRMDRSECNSDHNIECSVGLHSGNREFGFSGFGDTQILCLINPMDVVSIPKSNSNKMRSCAYLPVGVLKEEEEVNFLKDAYVMDLGDSYYINQVNKLNNFINSCTPKELVTKNVISDEIVNNVKDIADSFRVGSQEIDIEEITERLKKRVVRV